MKVKQPLAFGAMPWSARVGIMIVLTYLLVSVFAPVIAPFPQSAVVGQAFEPWGGDFVLGTDNLGRDMLSRLIYGARNTVGLAVVISMLSFAVGLTGGLLAASAGGWIDWGLSRVVDVAMAVPPLVLALLVLTVLGTELPVLVGTIALLDATKVFRLSRAIAQGIMTHDFVKIAILRRERSVWIMTREILPNMVVPLLAEFGVRFCYVFLFISGLCFLGLGLQPPAADWGSMVRDNASLIIFGDITPLLPALALATLAIAVNFVVDWLVYRSAR
jgi:peptide/nickel transport system permease protein